MKLFGRKQQPAERLAAPAELMAGEHVERSLRASLLYGTERIKGGLYLTSTRLLFEAEKGEARWMSVPYDEMREAGLHRWHHAPLGRSSLNQCLCVVTTKGEQVWLDFGEREEREWLPLVRAKIEAAQPEPAAPE